MRRMIAVAALAAVLQAAGAAAQTAGPAYPSKPVRLVVPFAPGGTLDITSRILAERLREQSGYVPIVDNRSGADGNIGAEFVARAAPDGHTVLMSAITIQVIQLALFGKLPYDLYNDFAPVTLLAQIPLLLVTHPALPVTSVRELVALGKKRPGQLLYSSTSTGSSTHLAGVMLDWMSGIKTVHIPYKGGGPATFGLVSGEVHYSFMPLALTQQYIATGRLRALGIASARRHADLPKLPTLGEAGVPGFEADSWYGVMVPVKTPRDIVAKLHADVLKAINSPELKKTFSEQGILPHSSTPEQFADYIRKDAAKYSRLVKETGLKPEK